MKSTVQFFLLVLIVGGLTSCAAVLVGGGATGGYYYEKNHKAIGQYSSDATITSKIKAKYVKDLALKYFDVSVSTNHGVVTLVGNVPAEKYRQRAIQVALHTKGVRAVDARNLTVSAKPRHATNQPQKTVTTHNKHKSLS